MALKIGNGLQTPLPSLQTPAAAPGRSQDKVGERPFLDMLAQGIQEVDRAEKVSQTSAMELAAGKHSNIHGTMLAATESEVAMRLLVQMRNKALEAYQDVMRMQV